MDQQLHGSLNVVALHPTSLRCLRAKAPFQWWIAGGWALDLFSGEQSRPHFDLDVAIARRDQGLARQLLYGWDFQYAVPGTSEPAMFKSWDAGQTLGFEIHGSWARENRNSPWQFEFLLHEIEQDVWSFRYSREVRHPVQRIGGQSLDGIPYLRPEIALLYKAVRLRQVDDLDFRHVLPHLPSNQRAQLARDILAFSLDHPWLTDLQ
jgi:hypothetical protein